MSMRTREARGQHRFHDCSNVEYVSTVRTLRMCWSIRTNSLEIYENIHSSMHELRAVPWMSLALPIPWKVGNIGMHCVPCTLGG